jgi:hypothetical protein
LKVEDVVDVYLEVQNKFIIQKLQDGELIVIGKVDDNGHDRLLNENEIQIARDHIASYLNKNDLLNYAMVNSEYNNILSKRLAYEKEKYNRNISHPFVSIIVV